MERSAEGSDFDIHQGGSFVWFKVDPPWTVLAELQTPAMDKFRIHGKREGESCKLSKSKSFRVLEKR